jgi:hypothetical protein
MQCGGGCALDSAGPMKIASAVAGGGVGAWVGGGFGTTSLSLAIPTTTLVLPANDVYRADLLFTLNSGP